MRATHETAPRLLAAFLQTTDSTAHEITGRLHIEATWLERWPTLSHGERKRAQIGVALWCQPRVLAIDEPTNHIDLPSLACLEEALVECPCALLLVSHDQYFLRRLTTSRWHIAAAQFGEPHGDMRLRVHEPFTSGSTAPTAAGQPASVPKRPG